VATAGVRHQDADLPGSRSGPGAYPGGWLHVTLHQVIANQILADDPPETWQTVQRLAGLGYDWHNVMHLIMGPVTEAGPERPNATIEPERARYTPPVRPGQG
jgi:hypothetical protein